MRRALGARPASLKDITSLSYEDALSLLEYLRGRLHRLPRRWKSLILVAFDAVALVGVLWLSYQLRLVGSFEPTMPQWVLILLAPVVALPIFLRFGLYRAVIRYLPERAVWTVQQAMVLATLGWLFVLYIAEVTRMAVLPRTVPVFYFLLGTIVIAGSRFAAKYVLYPARRENRLFHSAPPACSRLISPRRCPPPLSFAGFSLAAC